MGGSAGYQQLGLSGWVFGMSARWQADPLAIAVNRQHGIQTDCGPGNDEPVIIGQPNARNATDPAKRGFGFGVGGHQPPIPHLGLQQMVLLGGHKVQMQLRPTARIAYPGLAQSRSMGIAKDA